MSAVGMLSRPVKPMPQRASLVQFHPPADQSQFKSNLIIKPYLQIKDSGLFIKSIGLMGKFMSTVRFAFSSFAVALFASLGASCQGICLGVNCADSSNPFSDNPNNMPGMNGLNTFNYAMDMYGFDDEDTPDIFTCMSNCLDNHEASVDTCDEMFVSNFAEPPSWVPQTPPTTENPYPAPVTANAWCRSEADKKLQQCLSPFSTQFISCLP